MTGSRSRAEPQEGNDVSTPENILAPAGQPATETRGGQAPDWDNTRAGEPLPQLPEENNDPDAP
jgi:hypothetical protein